MNKIAKHTFSILLFLAFSLTSVFAKDGYNIKVKMDNYPSDTLVLGFHYGNKQYVKDTVAREKDGTFVFQADTLLPCGVYLLVMQPDNDFVQFMLPSDDQQMELIFDAKEAVKTMKVKGSKDNEVFYGYMKYLGDVRPKADALRAEFQEKKGNPADSARLADELAKLDETVKKYQADVVEKNAGSLVSNMVKAAIEPKIPEFEGDEKESALKRYQWFREHYFDNIEIADPCMLRTPVIHGKIDYYITKLTPQHPDSVNAALDYILNKIEPASETFKFYLIHYLNEYAKSKIVGFDACYVHLAKNYYCNGKAPWTEKDDLEKICDNANRLEPILIGRKAPEITMLDKDNKPIDLYSIESPYTVLIFWDPECGHCKKAAPHIVEFWNEYKESGLVKIMSVCTAVTDKAADCADSIEEKEFNDFINVTDPYIRSRYKTKYDIRSTPQIFILDKDKTILMKRIGGEQLKEVMQDIISVDTKKREAGMK